MSTAKRILLGETTPFSHERYIAWLSHLVALTDNGTNARERCIAGYVAAKVFLSRIDVLLPQQSFLQLGLLRIEDLNLAKDLLDCCTSGRKKTPAQFSLEDVIQSSEELSSFCCSEAEDVEEEDMVPYVFPFLQAIDLTTRYNQIRTAERSNLRHLVSYVASGMWTTLTTTALTACLAVFHGRVVERGTVIRGALDRFLSLGSLEEVATAISWICGLSLFDKLGTGARRFLEGICQGEHPHLCLLSLIAADAARLGCTKIVEKLISLLISTSVAAHRFSKKKELTMNLTKLPCAFFELQSAEKLEQLMYYPNDLEGVDVHLQTQLFAMIRCGVAVISTAYSLRGNIWLFAGLIFIAGCTQQMDTWGSTLSKRLARSAAKDAEELSSLYDQSKPTFMPCGAVLEHICFLRPSQSDLALMGHWNEDLQKKMFSHTKPQSFGARASRFVRASALPMLLSGFASTARFVLPLIALRLMNERLSSQGRAPISASVALEIQHVIHSALDLVKTFAVLKDTVLLNAFKAGVLLRLADAQSWEPCQRKAKEVTQRNCNSVIAASFIDVSFAYPVRNDRLIFSHSSFTIAFPKGQVVALVGQNGSGKSTALSLLLRLYEIEQGQIVLQSSDTPSFSLNDLSSTQLRRDLFAFVPQHSEIFPGTILDNVVLKEEEVSQAVLNRVRCASTLAACDDFILGEKGLPEGFGTMVGSGFVKLSGGQAQRLSIARAFFRNSQVLLMDEPTSALDPDTKRQILENLRGIVRGDHKDIATRCCVIVTHDKEVMQYADRVISLSEMLDAE